MGCFLGCFGGSKDANRRKKRNKVIHKDHRHGIQNPPQLTTFTKKGTTEVGESPVDLVPELRSEVVEELSSSPRKKVTFNSDITAYEPVSISTQSLPDINKATEKENIVISRKDNSRSGDESVTSSVGSYPTNHRYQNCRDSDDESEECDVSDLDDEDNDKAGYIDYAEDAGGRIVSEERDMWSESVITASMEARSKNSLLRVNSEEVNSPFKAPALAEQERKANGAKGNVRERSVYIDSVLNPVENLTQWKAVKSDGTMTLKPQKENSIADVETPPRISCSTEPTFKQSSSSFMQKSNQYKNLYQEIAVDASLSNWLVSPDTTTPSKNTSCSGVSQGSNSVISWEDRPILGALTVEELKQLSATSSPRKSPNRSPDDMPIIGTVGTYWNHADSAKDSNSASSFKGIPNTTSKYREDKKVNWHSTPFETRLERALKRNATEA